MVNKLAFENSARNLIVNEIKLSIFLKYWIYLQKGFFDKKPLEVYIYFTDTHHPCLILCYLLEVIIVTSKC